MFKVKDSEDMKKALSKLLDNSRKVKEFGKQNLKIVQERANLKNSLKIYERTMLSLIG